MLTTNEKSDNKPNTCENESIGAQVISILEVVGECLLLLVNFIWLSIVGIYRLAFPIPKKSVEGEIVLITGAGHGIGKELALQYASNGATVIGWDINSVNLNATITEIANRKFPKAYAYICDVANRDEVMKTAEKVQKDVGIVSILINNAGIMPCHPFLEHTPEEIHNIMNINIMAHYWTLQAFLPDMIKYNYGHIVAISSIAGHAGQQNIVPYCASKFAVRGLMESLYVEFRTNPNSKIKFTTICPYMVNTGLCKQPRIRFKSVLPLLNPECVAKYIMNAQRRNVLETTIPRSLFTIGYCARLLPSQMGFDLMEFIGSYLASDK